MGESAKKLDDMLLHYGVKGMKWRDYKLQDLSTSENTGAGGGSEFDKAQESLNNTSANLDKVGKDLENVRAMIGNGPLDMLKYIIFGTTAKPAQKSSSKSTGNDTFDKIGAQLKDIKSKVGNSPLDMLKYIITGKRKVQHSGLNDDRYIELGQKVVEELQHSGVKGMHWGVRRNHDGHGGTNGKTDQADKLARTTLGRKWNSLKRERQWHSVLKQVEHMSNVDISLVTKRLGLENNFKRLSRSKVATKKDKEDYLRRSHMDDQELSRKIARLALKDGLHKAVYEASKQQREFGKKVVNIGGSLGARYVLNKGSLGLDDVVGAFKDPKGSAATAKGDVQKELAKRGKEILKKARVHA